MRDSVLAMHLFGCTCGARFAAEPQSSPTCPRCGIRGTSVVLGRAVVVQEETWPSPDRVLGWVSSTELLRPKTPLQVIYGPGPEGYLTAKWAGCPHPAPVGFGGCETDAYHWLRIDTCHRYMHAGDDAVSRWVRDHFELVSVQAAYCLMSGGYPEDDYPVEVFLDEDLARADQAQWHGTYVRAVPLILSPECLAAQNRLVESLGEAD